MVILLAAVRALVHADAACLPDWLADHPVAIVQVSRYIMFDEHAVKFDDFEFKAL